LPAIIFWRSSSSVLAGNAAFTRMMFACDATIDTGTRSLFGS